MNSKKYILFFIIIPLCISNILAAHYIIGKVNDALDGTLANGRTVVIWNPSIGQQDNITDVVGPTGNSGQNNIYMVDCDLLTNGCSVGNTLNIKVVNTGDNYLSETIPIIITGSGYDLASDLTLNSPPTTQQSSPPENTNFSQTVILNCSAQDLDSNLKNITLFGNWSGGWHANETKDLTGSNNFTLFTKDIPEGTYKWGCFVSDNLSITNHSDVNKTFNVDKIPPTIYSITINQTYTCGNSEKVRINCTTNDTFTGIDKVIIEAISPTTKTNYSTQELIQDVFYADITLNEYGIWNFRCYSNDTSGNTVSNESENITTNPQNPDLTTNPEDISFSTESPTEGAEVTIEVRIYNKGCQAANNFLVNFYLGDPDSGGTPLGSAQTLSISERDNSTTNIIWATEIGPSNIYVKVDSTDLISEFNESNNKANRSINVGAWQDYYGTLNSSKILGDQSLSNLSFWFNESTSTGNIYVTDKESQINWGSLRAIGRNLTGEQTSNDFSDMDSNFGMTYYNDSITNKFTNDGNTPKATDSFFIHGSTINNVPIINSTNNTNFITGILWDSSSDTDGEYSITNNEKIAFVTKINKNKEGKYGKYDYEISIPVKLREQDETDNSELYFYYELI